MLLSKTTGTRTKMVCSTMPKAILGSRSFPSLNWNWRFLAKIEEERFNASIHGFFLRAETPWTLITHDSDPNNSHSDPNKLHCILNDELRNFDVWFKCNKLSVNLQKANYIIFKSRQKKLNYSFTLFFGNQSLDQANLTKFLGAYVDEHLTWKHHISYICV